MGGKVALVWFDLIHLGFALEVCFGFGEAGYEIDDSEHEGSKLITVNAKVRN